MAFRVINGKQKKFLLMFVNCMTNYYFLKVILKGIHLVSIMGNQGTLTKTYNQILIDFELWYHATYMVFCFLGILFHPFFYSVLVRVCCLFWVLVGKTIFLRTNL